MTRSVLHPGFYVSPAIDVEVIAEHAMTLDFAMLRAESLAAQGGAYAVWQWQAGERRIRAMAPSSKRARFARRCACSGWLGGSYAKDPRCRRCHDLGWVDDLGGVAA